MKTALVGCTGFVGGNLAAEHSFDGMFHSTDIEQAYGTSPELLVYAGMPAAKYLANKEPEKDWKVAENAFNNIEKIRPRKLVLISTVDVYAYPQGVDESTPADFEQPQAYGRNRARLEKMVHERWPDALIVRLPGLFGKGLKKNFLYDFLHRTPEMLKEGLYKELSCKSSLVKQSYAPSQNGFYKRIAQGEQAQILEDWFAHNDFNALCFTDSRASYQFYDLSCLWNDLSRALSQEIALLNLSTEPISAADVYAFLTNGEVFENICSAAPAQYDMRSNYADLWSGMSGYCYSREQVLRRIAAFIQANS